MDNSETVLQQAFAAHNAGRHDEAEKLCRALAESGGRDPQLFFLLGMALHKMDRDIEAIQWLKRAGQLQPQGARVWSGLGVVWLKLADFEKAARYFARAAELEPRQANHFYGLGNAAYQLNDLERAADAFERAVALNPGDAECWNNLGKCLKELNRVNESIAAYERAVQLKPGYLTALQGRAISLLTAGRLAEGYRDYEFRWRTLRRREFAMPRWNGQTVAGKTLFLHAEQGFGDGIQSARYAKLARKRCARVVLECRPELKRLFTHSGVADAVIAFGDKIPAADFVNSVVSLPGLLGFTLETIPGDVPYLRAPPAVRPIPAPAGQLKVGLVWAGSPTHRDDANRSMPLAMLAPVLAVPELTFYSLQLPVPRRDATTWKDFPNLKNFGVLKDYLDTASMVAEMDLVITVDTSVAHLAGALAKPVWTMVQFAPDWRWFAQFGDRTPWYPTMRLFRQPKRGDWQSVVTQVAAELSRDGDWRKASNITP
ncbi:MAG: tetratricopeptide repeat-containing glycosyltransferase family protein [Verrucomicrobiota bacterium]|jgi:tetratricopeptide (TPR) repeat protein